MQSIHLDTISFLFCRKKQKNIVECDTLRKNPRKRPFYGVFGFLRQDFDGESDGE